MLKSPADVSKHHHEQEYRADELQESPHRPLPGESDERDEKDRANRHTDCKQSGFHFSALALHLVSITEVRLHA